MQAIPLLDWSQLHTHLTWAYEGPVAENFRHFIHNPQNTNPGRVGLWHLLQGSVAVQRRDGTQLKAKKGDFVLLSRPHRQDFSEDACIRSISFHLSWSGRTPLFPNTLSCRRPASDAPRLMTQTRQLIRLCSEINAKSPTLFALTSLRRDQYLRVQGLYNRWAMTFIQEAEKAGWKARVASTADPRLAKAMEHLESSPQTSIAETARAAGLSLSQLERLFKERYGQSPRQHQDRLKWNLAEHRLRHSDDTIKHIAYDLGFRQLSHFSAWFKRHAQCSPREYRNIGKTQQDL